MHYTTDIILLVQQRNATIIAVSIMFLLILASFDNFPQSSFLILHVNCVRNRLPRAYAHIPIYV